MKHIHHFTYTGGCKDSGIPEESIWKAHKALQWYAWKNLNVGGRRRLTLVGDQQLQVDNQEEEEQVFPTRRALRANAVDIGEDEFDQFERNDLFDGEFEDENIGYENW